MLGPSDGKVDQQTKELFGSGHSNLAEGAGEPDAGQPGVGKEVQERGTASRGHNLTRQTLGTWTIAGSGTTLT